VFVRRNPGQESLRREVGANVGFAVRTVIGPDHRDTVPNEVIPLPRLQLLHPLVTLLSQLIAGLKQI
jgi:hypothetical protein